MKRLLLTESLKQFFVIVNRNIKKMSVFSVSFLFSILLLLILLLGLLVTLCEW